MTTLIDDDPLMPDNNGFGDSFENFEDWGAEVDFEEDVNFFAGGFAAEGSSASEQLSSSSQDLTAGEEEGSSPNKKSQRRSVRRAAGDKRPLRRKSELPDTAGGDAAEGNESRKAGAQPSSSRRPHSLRKRLSKDDLVLDEKATENSGGAATDGKESRKPPGESRRNLLRRRHSKSELTDESGAPDAGEGRTSRRPSDSRKPHAGGLRRRLSKAELKDDTVADSTTDAAAADENDSLNNGRKDVTPEPSASSHSSRRTRHVGRASLKTKSPVRRSLSTEKSLRNLIAALGSSNPELLDVNKDDDEMQSPEPKIAAPVVSKSVRRRHDLRTSMSVRGLGRTNDSNNADDNNKQGETDQDPANIPTNAENPDPNRRPPERSNSVRARKSGVASAEGSIGAARARHDFSRTQPSRTASTTSRRTAPGRGLPGRSASFVVRRDHSSNAALGGGAASNLAAMAVSQQNAAGTTAGAKPEPTRGVGRSVSINSGPRRRPPMRNDTLSGTGLPRPGLRGNSDQPIQRAASFRFISGVEGL